MVHHVSFYWVFNDRIVTLQTAAEKHKWSWTFCVLYLYFWQMVSNVQHVVNCLTLTGTKSSHCQRTWLWKTSWLDTQKSVVVVCAFRRWPQACVMMTSRSIFLAVKTAEQSPVPCVTCAIRLQSLHAELRGSVTSVALLTALRVSASFIRSVALWPVTAFTPSRRPMTSVDLPAARTMQVNRRRCSATVARFMCVIYVSVTERVVTPATKCSCLKRPARWSRYCF